jgi:hypothetical protein
VNIQRDFSRELGILRSAGKWGRVGWKLGRQIKASRIRGQSDAEYGAETAEAAAIASARNPKPIVNRAERDRLLINQSVLHGSVAWTDVRRSRTVAVGTGSDSFHDQQSAREALAFPRLMTALA